jgi:flagellar basal body-associated protein FliL
MMRTGFAGYACAGLVEVLCDRAGVAARHASAPAVIAVILMLLLRAAVLRVCAYSSLAMQHQKAQRETHHAKISQVFRLVNSFALRSINS